MVRVAVFLAVSFVLFASSASAQRCDSNITLGYGDTTKPSDTRFAVQWCRGTRSTSDRVMRKAFVPGTADRIFNNSLSPCESIQKATLYCGSKVVSRATLRPGCPNGRSAFDFCGPKGGGAKAIDRACRGKRMTVRVTRTNGSTFCYNPPGANITFRNGKVVPNRTSR